MLNAIRYILAIFFFTIGYFSYAQQLSVINNFTISDGLPSNHVYKCLQDKKGFIWVATENGLSRFDGHRFTNFSVKDGLPDNDILDIFLDSAGNVWTIPFSKNPACFNAETNKITSAAFANVKGSSILLGHALYDGTVAFYDNVGKVFIADQEKLIGTYDFKISHLIHYNKNTENEIAVGNNHLYLFKNGQIEKSRDFNTDNLSFVRVGEENNNLLFIRSDSTIIQLSDLDKNLSPTIVIKKYPFRFWNIAYLKNYIGVAARNGFIYLLDKATLEIKTRIATGANVKNIIEDRDGNLWVATDDKGIIKFGDPLIKSIGIPIGMPKDILSLFVDSTKIILGNISGDILEYRKNVFYTNRVMPNKEMYNNFYVKKIIAARNHIYVIAFQGLFIKNVNSYKQVGEYKGFKDAFLKNDSLLILGAHNCVYEFNLAKNQFKKLVNQRASAVTANSSGSIYIGSNDGLYKWQKNRLEFLGTKNSAFTGNVTKLFTTKDDIIWMGLSSDSLMAIRDDSVLLKIPLSNITEGVVCKTLGSDRAGVLWAGTDRSLVKIEYKLSVTGIIYTSASFNKMDGLSDGQVNDIAFRGDSIYVATSFGISKFSSNLVTKVKDIPVYVTKIEVNGVDIPVQDKLNLAPTENNIQIQFSGIELSGYSPHFQFRINNESWQNIISNTISLGSLSSGTYKVEIRALKKNNEASGLLATVNININTPLWKKAWFIISLLMFTFFSFFYFFNKFRLRSQKRKFEQQLALDQQRLKITADLHDDIGASLSSLQVNSAVAAHLLNTDLLQAKNVLRKIEAQSKSISENIGDIIWSMKPAKDEFMTMSSRIKTFVTDMLGATNIEYSIHIDRDADTVIKNFTARKNVVLIIKEALNNAVKYSGASNINIALHIKGKTVIINVEDNGRGMRTVNKPGNGLGNMKKRTEELNGHFEIISAIEKGTKITASFPVP